MTDKPAKILERVRALLAKADSTEFEEEAKSFRAKADDLMVAYAIDRWQVDQAQEAVGARAKPEHLYFDITWYFDTKNFIRESLWRLLIETAGHCRIAVAPHAATGSKQRCSVPIIGMPEDLEYFQLLFTSLYLQLSKTVAPTYNERLTEAENIAVFKEAGLPWREIAKLIGKPEFVMADGKVVDKGYMGRVYKKFCEEQGIPTISVNPATYQREFSAGWVSGVRTQFHKQNTDRAKGESRALVIRDIREHIQDAANEMFPRSSKSVSKYKRDTRKADWAAREKGQVEGKNAKIVAHQNRRVKSTKQIGE